MSGRELSRVQVLGRVKAQSLRLVDAAVLMGVGYRQAKRLWRRFRRGGAAAVRHGHVWRGSNRERPGKLRARVLALIRKKYSGDVSTRFGPTLVAEHLASEDGVTVDHETVRRWMLAAGLWSRQRKRSPYRQRRERKAHFGELVQFDGSFHKWYEDRGPERCLITMVDDATSQSTGRFSGEETIWAAAAVLRTWIEQHGVPLALYTDWKNVYVRAATEAEQAAGQVPVTQFGRMCAALQIQIIPANSPQAKGRVERNHGTHQDWLIKKMRRVQIADDTAANHYLATAYWTAHNDRFAQAAADATDFHRRAHSIRSFGSKPRARSASTGWCGTTTASFNWHGRAAMPRPAVRSACANGPMAASPSSIARVPSRGRKSRAALRCRNPAGRRPLRCPRPSGRHPPIIRGGARIKTSRTRSDDRSGWKTSRGHFYRVNTGDISNEL